MNILIINHYAGSPEMGWNFVHIILQRNGQLWDTGSISLPQTFSHLRRVNPDVSRDFQEES